MTPDPDASITPEVQPPTLPAIVKVNDAPVAAGLFDQDPARDSDPPRVVLSYGLGVDSTGILLRWLRDPASRDFGLHELVVITAQTGDEWERTGELVERHVYPLLAHAGVRTIQVARAGPSTRDGVAVLADTRTPGIVHLAGAYRLSDELLANGTVPQYGGTRRCSVKAKGWALDTVIARITQNRPYRHVMGFECTETGRIEKDQKHRSSVRIPEYPLQEWGWDRAACENYIRAALGVEWPKSACTYCVFAMANKAGRERALAGFSVRPEAAVLPLRIELIANALNPTQSLIPGGAAPGDRRLLDLIRNDPNLAQAWEAFRESLAAQSWALYDVRRVRCGDVVPRSLRVRATGTAQAMRDLLADHANQHGYAGPLIDPRGGHSRIWLQTPARDAGRERLLVVAPAAAHDKERESFASAWNATFADTLPGA